MNVIKETTGIQLDGFDIERILITNDNNVKLSVLSVGCAIEGFYVPDKHGQSENIVLSYDDVNTYIENPDYFGSIVGRTAGRISNGRFELEGQTYELDKNDQDYNLHAGDAGLQKRNWKAELIEEENAAGVVFTHESPDGDGGFPGHVKLSVKYMLDEDNTLHMTYEGTTDAPTILNMTNHTYFNLSGDVNRQVFNHRLWINSEQFAPIQENGCPVGLLAGVDGTAFDFREEKTIGQDIGANETQIMRGGGFDHPFVLEKGDAPQIKLSHPETGRQLLVWTDQDAVVVYTANHLDHKAICLETQNLPDHVNRKGFPFEAVTPDKPYKAQTKIKIGQV